VRISFQSSQHWQELNESVDVHLGLKERQLNSRLYAGLNHALTEVALGLIKQFPHKKKAYFVKGQSPAFEQQMIGLAREGLQISPLDSLNAPVDPEALFVLYSEDDPLFGLLYDVEALETSLKDTKVFRLRVSHVHQAFLPLPKELSRFDVRLCAVSPKVALVITSERLRWPALSAEGLAFSEDDLAPVRQFKSPDFLNPHDVETFESLPIDGMVAPLKGRHRIYDRAVVSWRDMDGWAVISRLAEQLKFKLPPAGFASPLETTSLRRWGGYKTMDWLSEFGFDDHLIRGTIMIDHTLLNKDLPPLVEKVREQILKIQVGD